MWSDSSEGSDKEEMPPLSDFDDEEPPCNQDDESSEEGAIKVLSFDTALGSGGPERGSERFQTLSSYHLATRPESGEEDVAVQEGQGCNAHIYTV